MERSPFFSTYAEAQAWADARPSRGVNAFRFYKTRTLHRWRAVDEELDNSPPFSREAIMLVSSVPTNEPYVVPLAWVDIP